MKKNEAYHLVLHRGKPHGFKGHIKFQYACNLSEDFCDVDYVFVLQDGKYIPYFIEENTSNDSNCILKFEGINDTTIRISEVYLLSKDATQFIVNEEDNIFSYIIGYKAITQKDKELGIIEDIIEYPGQYLALIMYNNHEMLLPLVATYIGKIDKKKSVIQFILPDGFLELYST